MKAHGKSKAMLEMTQANLDVRHELNDSPFIHSAASSN